MSVIQKIGGWTLDNPLTVLSGCMGWVGFVVGLCLSGLSGAAIGAIGGCLLSVLLAVIESKDLSLGPHQ